MGVETGVEATMPLSLKRSKVYLCWHKWNPLLALANSSLRKYIKSPRFFILKVLSSILVMLIIYMILLLAIMMSSTYTSNTNRVVELE